MEKMTEAMNDFNKAVTVNPNFPIAYVRKCYADYWYAFSTRNMEKIEEVMKAFQQAIQKFPMCSKCYTLFVQVRLKLKSVNSNVIDKIMNKSITGTQSRND
jgi:import receptor subunit TOM70